MRVPSAGRLLHAGHAGRLLSALELCRAASPGPAWLSPSSSAEPSAISTTASSIGRVTDFLHFYIGPHTWPDFNVADSAIVSGATLLCIDLIFGSKSTGED